MAHTDTAFLIAGVGFVLFALGILLPMTMRSTPKSETTRDLTPVKGRRVTVVIAAYLESSVIGETVRRLEQQLRQSDVAKSRILVVASDVETLEAAEGAGADTLFQPPEGKPRAVNAGVAHAAGDVIVLTDANACIQPDDWPSLVLVSLEAASLVSCNKTESGGREQAFWAYEHFVKGATSGPLSENLAVVGEFLAFRAEDYRPIETKTLVDDVETAVCFDQRGLLTVVDTRIIVSEKQAAIRDQWERRIRIAAGVIETSTRRFRALASTRAGRRFLLHKSYRVTIGALGFWMCVLGLAAAHVPIGAVAMAAVATAFAVYWTQPTWSPGALSSISAAVALQGVPVLATARVAKRAFGVSSTGWKKVAR